MVLSRLIFLFLTILELIFIAIKYCSLILFTIIGTSVPFVASGLMLGKIDLSGVSSQFIIPIAIGILSILFINIIRLEIQKTKNLFSAVINSREDALMKIQKLYDKEQSLKKSIDRLENEYKIKKSELSDRLSRQDHEIKSVNLKMAENIRKHNESMKKKKEAIDQELHEYALKKAIEHFSTDAMCETIKQKKVGNGWDH